MLELCKLCDGVTMLCCLTVLTVFSNKERGFGTSLGIKLCLKILYANNTIAVLPNYSFSITHSSTKSTNSSFGEILLNTDLSGALPLSYRKSGHKAWGRNKGSCARLFCMFHLGSYLFSIISIRHKDSLD